MGLRMAAIATVLAYRAWMFSNKSQLRGRTIIPFTDHAIHAPHYMEFLFINISSPAVVMWFLLCTPSLRFPVMVVALGRHVFSPCPHFLHLPAILPLPFLDVFP
jgi:hypothetical protein